MNKNNVAHEMDAGGKWETINQLGVALTPEDP